jgi:putative protease
MKNTKFSRPEILSPAGNPEKLAAALRFGADAVYLAGQRFGMRAAADNFSVEELRAAANTVHAAGKKLYLTLNTLPHGYEYPALEAFLTEIKCFGIDAFIVADLGVMALLRRVIPSAAIHISTQASIMSPDAARAYAAMGAERLVLARELALDEIAAIRAAIPDTVELEAFVHGSMCISYSGRCLLSSALTGRDANRGACTQPCRWGYTIVEEKRPEDHFPIEESPVGTFIMSSKDMCMIEHVGKLWQAGVSSFKIEGRMKSAYYTAVVTNAYKMALDACEKSGDIASFTPDAALYDELCSVSHREYCTGFYFDSPADTAQTVTRGGYVREKAYLAVALGEEAPEGVEAVNEKGRVYKFAQRNKLISGEHGELLTPGRVGIPFEIGELYAEDGTVLDCAPHPSMIFYMRMPFEINEGDIVRAAGGNDD